MALSFKKEYALTKEHMAAYVEIGVPAGQPRASGDRHTYASPQQVGHLTAGLGDLRLRVAEGAAVAGKDEFDVEPLDRLQAGEEFADRVGAVAVVEEEHGPAEQVVAGDHQLAVGLVEDDMRGGRGNDRTHGFTYM